MLEFHNFLFFFLDFQEEYLRKRLLNYTKEMIDFVKMLIIIRMATNERERERESAKENKSSGSVVCSTTQ